jgi:lipoyl-dependent peroxiredoxin
MIRHASANWKGDLRSGIGIMSTDTAALKDQRYNFGSRFETAPGTNPEELIAAAHAGCFSMALSAELFKAGLKADSIDTKAALTLEMLESGPTVTAIHLETRAKVPGATAETFAKAADTAKAGCPISRLLNAKITLDAKLEA